MSTNMTELQIQLNDKIAEFKGKTPTEEEKAELQKLINARRAEVAEMQAKAALDKEAALPESGESRGLGDTIKKVTNKLGVKQCGACKRRQLFLNKMFPYK